MATLAEVIGRLTEAQRRQLYRAWEQSAGRLTENIGNRLVDLQDEIELLARDIEEGRYTQTTVKRSQRYKRLMRALSIALIGFATFTLDEARGLQQTAIGYSSRNIIQLVSLQMGSKPDWTNLQREAVDVLADYLAVGSPLYQRIEGLASVGADKVTQAILDAIGVKANSTEAGRMISDAFGIPLTDALRMTRTSMSYSYREANRLQYMSNPDTVEGWIWYSALEPGRTCMSCVNLHGTFHPADEVQNDHHNGLCTSIPKVIGVQALVTESGEEWFNRQANEIQQKMMGRAMYDEWREGNVAIGDMTKRYQDDVFGEMLRQASLKELVSDR